MEKTNVKRFLPHCLGATFLVVVLPLLVVSVIERAAGIGSSWLTAGLGIALSAGAAVLGSALWMRRPAARDIVFGDLMLWGWVRRLRNERRLAEIGATLADDADVPRERRVEMLKQLASTLEARDAYTHGHTRRVARHAYMIAKTMGLPEEVVDKVHTAAAVHDVGKVRVPLEVLNKPGRLTDDEFDEMKRHSVYGAEMLESVGDPELTAIVRHHHERLDGRGYPDRLSGEDIPVGARIIAVADTFDAITSTRSYRNATKHKKAIEILKEEAGAQLDPEAVTAFLAYYSGRSSFAWWASLSTLPQRLVATLGGWFSRAGAASLANAAAATGGAAVLLGGAMAPAVPAAERQPHRVAVQQMRPAVVQASSQKAGEKERRRPEGSSKKKIHRGRGRRAPQRARPKSARGKEGGAGRPSSPPGQESSEAPTAGGGSAPAPTGGSGDSPSGPGGSSDGDSSSGGSGGSGSGGVVDGVTDTVDDTVDDTVEIVDDTVDDTVGTVGDTVDTVDDTVDDTLDTVNDTVGGLNDVVKGATGGLKLGG